MQQETIESILCHRGSRGSMQNSFLFEGPVQKDKFPCDSYSVTSQSEQWFLSCGRPALASGQTGKQTPTPLWKGG